MVVKDFFTPEQTFAIQLYDQINFFLEMKQLIESACKMRHAVLLEIIDIAFINGVCPDILMQNSKRLLTELAKLLTENVNKKYVFGRTTGEYQLGFALSAIHADVLKILMCHLKQISRCANTVLLAESPLVFSFSYSLILPDENIFVDQLIANARQAVKWFFAVPSISTLDK